MPTARARSTSAQQKQQAAIAKFMSSSGKGFWGTLGGIVTGAADVFLQGGTTQQAIAGGIIGGFPTSGGGPVLAPAGLAAGCPAGQHEVGGACVEWGAIFPGGDPFIAGSSGGQAVVGAFGMAALTPDEQLRRVRRCPAGMVLGKFDDLCYPKSVLPRRSKFRKWKGERRPIMSAADGSTIRKAAAIKERVLTTAKAAGLHASKSAPKRLAKPQEVVVHGGTLPVVTDHHHH